MPYRVLEVSSARTSICGQILADLGADVVVVEPPAGSTARRMAPFADDLPGPETSLYWPAYNSGTRSATLDLDTNDGGELFGRLVLSADIVIEGCELGYLSGLGLGYASPASRNPQLRSRPTAASSSSRVAGWWK